MTTSEPRRAPGGEPPGASTALRGTPLEEQIRSFDGTPIAIRSQGEGSGMPIVLANGIGARHAMWRRACDDLAATHTVVAWDHRGLHRSGATVTNRIDPGAHAEDAIAAADHHGLQRFGLLAWSTGGRIALEIAHRHPHRVSALAMVCAGYGHPIKRLWRRLEVSSALPALAGMAKHFPEPIEGLLRGFVARPEIAGLVRQSGMIGPTAEIPALVSHLRELASCDARALLATFEAVVGDNGEDILAGIEVATLLVAGERDTWTALGMMQEMATRIPAATLIVYEGATHFLPIEHPERLAADLAAFFDST